MPCGDLQVHCSFFLFLVQRSTDSLQNLLRHSASPPGNHPIQPHTDSAKMLTRLRSLPCCSTNKKEKRRTSQLVHALYIQTYLEVNSFAQPPGQDERRLLHPEVRKAPFVLPRHLDQV